MESLLKAGTTEFLERPALEVTAQSVAKRMDQSMIGKTLAHFRVLEKIGSGGMGDVYLAEDMTLGNSWSI